MKYVVRGVKKGGARDSKGQFVSQPQTPQGGNVPQSQRPQDAQATIDAMREKAKKGPLSESDEVSVLDALFGTTDPIWKD